MSRTKLLLFLRVYPVAEDETSSGFCFVSVLRVTVTPGLNWGLNLYLVPNLHYYQLIVELVEYMYIYNLYNKTRHS